MNRFESFYPHILSSGRCGICTRLKIWLTWFDSTLLNTMYCKIMKVDCPHAGQIKLERCMEMGEEKGDYEYTICYKEGGRLACTLGI